MKPTDPPPSLVSRFHHDVCALVETPRLALAVSGGPDSLALLLLAAAAYPSRIEAATVDHGLRPEAADEAALVARHCAALGVPHEALAVSVVAQGEGLQSAARRARYAALGEWMVRRAIPTLLTAHHADDQAETLLMRLARGSGVAGLASIRASGPIPGCPGPQRLYRPLLGWRRSELAAIVAASGFEAVTDPGNSDKRFDRARIRRHLAEAPWLDPAALARSATALADAEDALAHTADALFATRVRRIDGALMLDAAGLPRELTRRLAARCLTTLAPDAAPRGDQLTALLERLEGGATTTLCGAKCTGPTPFRFEPAPARRPLGRQGDAGEQV